MPPPPARSPSATAPVSSASRPMSVRRGARNAGLALVEHAGGGLRRLGLPASRGLAGTAAGPLRGSAGGRRGAAHRAGRRARVAPSLATRRCGLRSTAARRPARYGPAAACPSCPAPSSWSGPRWRRAPSCSIRSMRGGEDVDLEWRLADAGWDVRYEPRSVVAHDGRGDGRCLPRPARLLRHLRRAAGPAPRRRHGAGPTSGWSVAVWLLGLLRRPGLAMAAQAASIVLLAHRLRGLVRDPVAVAAKIAGGGTARAAVPALGGIDAGLVARFSCSGWLFRRTRTRRRAGPAVVPALRDWGDDRQGTRPRPLRRAPRGGRRRLRRRRLGRLPPGAHGRAAGPPRGLALADLVIAGPARRSSSAASCRALTEPAAQGDAAIVARRSGAARLMLPVGRRPERHGASSLDATTIGCSRRAPSPARRSSAARRSACPSPLASVIRCRRRAGRSSPRQPSQPAITVPTISAVRLGHDQRARVALAAARAGASTASVEVGSADVTPEAEHTGDVVCRRRPELHGTGPWYGRHRALESSAVAAASHTSQRYPTSTVTSPSTPSASRSRRRAVSKSRSRASSSMRMTQLNVPSRPTRSSAVRASSQVTRHLGLVEGTPGGISSTWFAVRVVLPRRPGPPRSSPTGEGRRRQQRLCLLDEGRIADPVRST